MDGDDGLAVVVALEIVEKRIDGRRLQFGHGIHARLLGIAQRAKEVVGGKIAVLFIERAADLETMRNDLNIVAGQYFLRQIGIAIRNDAYFAHGLEGNLLCLVCYSTETIK